MRAMILAAGRGERLRPLTDSTPKPLLQVGGERLIEYHLHKLAAFGIKYVVINVNYKAKQIMQTLGDGARYGVNIVYSYETEKLGVGGGIRQALDFLGPEPFIVVSADVWTDFSFDQLPQKIPGLAHLVLLPERAGVFQKTENGCLSLSKNGIDYAGISLMHPDLFSGFPEGEISFMTVIEKSIAQQGITGEFFNGQWCNANTLAELQYLREQLG